MHSRLALPEGLCVYSISPVARPVRLQQNLWLKSPGSDIRLQCEAHSVQVLQAQGEGSYVAAGCLNWQ